MVNHDQTIMYGGKIHFQLKQTKKAAGKTRMSLEYKLSRVCPSILSVTIFHHIGEGQCALLTAQKVTQTHRDKVIK